MSSAPALPDDEALRIAAPMLGADRSRLMSEAHVDHDVLDRAEVWRGTFSLEQVSAAMLRGEAEEVIAALVERTTTWLRSDDAARLDV